MACQANTMLPMEKIRGSRQREFTNSRCQQRCSLMRSSTIKRQDNNRDAKLCAYDSTVPGAEYSLACLLVEILIGKENSLLTATMECEISVPGTRHKFQA